MLDSLLQHGSTDKVLLLPEFKNIGLHVMTYSGRYLGQLVVTHIALYSVSAIELFWPFKSRLTNPNHLKIFKLAQVERKAASTSQRQKHIHACLTI